jgi:DNA invertase Pin-like site-specific DNA recombinase
MADRLELERMLRSLDPGDIVTVTKLDRARTLDPRFGDGSLAARVGGLRRAQCSTSAVSDSRVVGQPGSGSV